ncbi:MAG TPA: universal stress protein [Thermodesulfobacteriota bacterium]|nr:universal stress protein [Thermodesulfobacteriota bacterium]
MYKKILFCLDNSDCANRGIELGVSIASTSGAQLTGCHVYAAKLHNMRFQQMESGLPPQYQKEEELKKQREVHDTLITKGLQIISDSYVTVLQARAAGAGLSAESVSREGKNFEELVSEASEGGYDLVVIGALGLGRVGSSRVGSVCERVVRRLKTDILVSRGSAPAGGSKITVAVDGSASSFGGLLTAIELSKVFDCEVEAVSVFDPDYHYKAFRSIAGVLTKEAGALFKFQEQEKLHEEVIDSGLAKIYRGHLKTAETLAGENGCRITTKLLSGKPYDELIKHVAKTSPFLLVMGKTGFHSTPTLDIGSNTENCLREVSAHLLISQREFVPSSRKEEGSKPLQWSPEAAATLEKVPPFARGIVKNMVEESARKADLDEVTLELMMKVRKKMDG